MKQPERAARELRRREASLQKPRGRFYLPYLIFIITLVYVTDEIASQIGTLMKTEIANDMLAHFGQSSRSGSSISRCRTASGASRFWSSTRSAWRWAF